MGQPVLKELGEGEGCGFEVSIPFLPPSRLVPLWEPPPWLVVQPGLGTQRVKAWVASAHPRGGSGEELGGVSSPAGCVGCSTQKQEAPVGAPVTGLM